MGLVTLSSIALGSQVAHADATLDTDGNALQAKSNTSVKFIQDTTKTDPVNPDDPDGDGVGEDGTTPVDTDHTKDDGVTNETDGELTLDYVSNFRFGEQAISSGKDYTFEAAKDGTHSNYIQVTDKRLDIAGWNVKATAEALTDGTNTLNGVTYTISDAKVTTLDNTTAPATGPATITLDTEGNAVDVMNAKAGEGNGTSIDKFGKVEMTLPKGQVDGTMTGEFTGAITWDLANTPV